jgi:hypothetical protein
MPSRPREFAPANSRQRRRRRRRIAAMLAISALTLLVGAALALAKPHKHHKACSPSKGKAYPRVLSPCNGASVSPGKAVTFTVEDLNVNAKQFPPFLNLNTTKPRHGILADNKNGKGVFDSLKPIKGHPGRFKVTPKLFNFPGYWLLTKGTYYVQVQQVDATMSHLTAYGPVTTIKVR